MPLTFQTIRVQSYKTSREIILVIAACLLFPLFGCRSSQDPHAVKMGQVQYHYQEKGLAEPQENDWIKVAFVGPHLRKQKKGEWVYSWAFMFRHKSEAPSTVAIWDVTDAKYRTNIIVSLLEFDQEGTAIVSSLPVSIHDPSAAWLCTKSESRFVFEIQVTNRSGQTKSLRQASIFSPNMKRKFCQVLKADAK